MRMSTDPGGVVLLFVVLRQAVRRGIPLGQALRSTAGETGIPVDVLASMAAEIENGDPLSEALERRPAWFPPPLAALVAAGERSARLDETLDACVAMLRRRDRVRSRLGAALVYPGLCLGFLAATIAVHAVADPLGRMAMLGPAIQDQVAANPSWSSWLIAVLVVGAVSMLVLRARPDWRDRVRLDLPVTGRLRRLAAAAGFTRALAALLERGAAVDTAIAAAIPCADNRWIEERLRRRLDGVRDGEGLARSLALPGVFPPSLTWRLAVGEKRGTFAEALSEAANAYEDELEVRCGRVARLIEPAALILVGLLAALVLRLVTLWYPSGIFSQVF